MICKREESARVDQATSRGAQHQRLPRHQEEAPMGDLEALGFICLSFYFELSFVLKKEKNKKRTNNSLFIACLTNLNPRGP